MIASDQLCAAILCTANEGGIGYWAYTSNILRTEADEWEYASFVVEDTMGEDDWRHVVDYDAVRRGIAKMLEPDAKVRHSTVAHTLNAVANDDAGEIDADVADAIVQFACFGEIVYG